MQEFHEEPTETQQSGLPSKIFKKVNIVARFTNNNKISRPGCVPVAETGDQMSTNPISPSGHTGDSISQLPLDWAI